MLALLKYRNSSAGATGLHLYRMLAIVTIKYATFVMMANNKGSIFALSWYHPPTSTSRPGGGVVTCLGAT